jgi:hypothetical protein
MRQRQARFSGKELRRQAQLAALEEWNSDESRSRWTSPVGQPFYFGHPPALGEPETVEDTRRFHRLLCEGMLAELRPSREWMEQARWTLHDLADEDVGGKPEPLVEAIRTIVQLNAAQLKRGGGDWRRENVFERLDRLLGRKATVRELALASILCGTEINTAGRKTVADAIQGEVKAMRQLQKRK